MDRKKVFLDTNVYIDYLERREGFRAALALFKLSAIGEIKLAISDLSIANSKYITRKTIPLETFYSVTARLQKYFSIVSVGSDAVECALALKAKDFEDALQYYSALQAEADYIVTNNTSDFYFATSIEIIEPDSFIEKFFPEEY